VERTWTALAVAGLLAASCSAGLAQQYNPPANGRTVTPGGQTYVPSPSPAQSNPDPAGLLLAAFGTAAVFGHVLRQKRRAV
jgi:hypothetical protein